MEFEALLPLIVERSRSAEVAFPSSLKTKLLLRWQAGALLLIRRSGTLRRTGENGKITNKEYQELNNTIDRTALRDIEELMNKDIFKREGDGKNTYYRI